MRTTLVTGGAGFIGSHFVERLFDQTDDTIIVLDAFTYASNPANIPERIKAASRFRLVRGNICDADLVEGLMLAADRVVHFAAESHVTRSIADDKPFFETDVMGTHTIAAAVARHRVHIERFVHISTSEVYGTAEAAPMTEEHPLNPCTPYAAAKAGADRLVYAYGKTYGIPLVILRPFNNYGPKQHLEKVVPRFIAGAILNEPLKVHGDGQMTRDWLHVTDTTRAVMHALESPTAVGQVINLGTGRDVSILEIARAILAILGKPESLIEHVAPRPGQVDRHISSIAKAYGLLAWGASIPLLTGLESTVEWYEQNPDWWMPRLDAREVRLGAQGF